MSKKYLFYLFLLGASFSPLINYASATVIKNDEIVDQQGKEVTGTIFDETNAPIAGATITVKNSTRGCITDLDGKFTIIVSIGDELQVNFLGYQPATIKVG